MHSSMPQAAIEAAVVDHVVPAAEIADLLLKLTAEQLPASDLPKPELIATETRSPPGGRDGR